MTPKQEQILDMILKNMGYNDLTEQVLIDIESDTGKSGYLWISDIINEASARMITKLRKLQDNIDNSVPTDSQKKTNCSGET